jgi:hypothetical protein
MQFLISTRFRILKEAEKKDKLDMAKRERELKHQQFIEEKKRKQDEVNRQKQEEKLKKLQEVELKRHQAALYKEQVSRCLSYRPRSPVAGRRVVSRPQVSNPSLGTAGPGLHVQGPFPGPPAPGRWRPACLLPRPQDRNLGIMQEIDKSLNYSKVNAKHCRKKMLERG